MGVDAPALPASRHSTRLVVRAALLLLGAAGAGAGLWILAAVPPTEDDFYPRCSFYQLTGWHCPGCGTTRALHAALNGRLAQAAAYNFLSFVVVPVVGWSLIQSLRAWRSGKTLVESKSTAGWITRMLLVAIVAYGILRNLPWHPFTLLAPHTLT